MSEICMIIPYYNDRHLPLAADSLRKQSICTDIVVVDDASTLSPALPKDIPTIRLSQNSGVGCALNAGIKYAFGRGYKYIGVLASDAIAHRFFIESAIKSLTLHPTVLGVSAKKGIANGYSRIARLKFHYKIYKEDAFQMDCSLYRRETFLTHRIPNARSGEDSVFIQSFQKGQLAKIGPEYYHFEKERVQDFFRDEFYGPYYCVKFKIPLKQLAATPVSSLKMILLRHWFLEGLLFPFRQFVWVLGFLFGMNLQR